MSDALLESVEAFGLLLKGVEMQCKSTMERVAVADAKIESLAGI